MTPTAPSPRPDPASRPPRVPLGPIALTFAVGILIDRLIAPIGSSAWGLLGVASALAAMTATVLGRDRGAFALGMAALVALGGGYHHRRWADLPPSDLAGFDWSRPEPAWLRGVLADLPEFRPGGVVEGDNGSTRVELDVSGLNDGRLWRPASGRVLVYVSGDRSDLPMGAAVTAAGSLQAIPGPLNPGAADRRDRWQSRGVRLRLSIDDPAGLAVDPEGDPSAWRIRLGRLRAEAKRRLVEGLDPRVAPLAAALLLGRREAIDPDVNDAFARTGTTHILAISGLHMQALAFLLGLILIPVVRGLRTRVLIVLAATALYTILVGGMPSVVRSAVMTGVACLAVIVARRRHVATALAAAGVATLVFNPAYLFDIGCQLSFLAVAALAFVLPPIARGLGIAPEALGDDGPPATKLDAVERRLATPGRRLVLGFWDWSRLLVLGSVVVWAVTLPLVMARFHLVPTIGVVLNLVLIPLAMPTLATAALTLVVGLASPALAAPFAAACESCLRLNLAVVEWGAALPGGHAFVAGPPGWWVAGFYALLAAAMLASRQGRRARRLAWSAWIGWLGAGATLAIWPTAPDVPEAHILAVDHGLAVILRTPDGRTTLYDCGKMRDPAVGRRIVAPALWAVGARRVDTLILSHADSDHYDGVPDLLERLPIGEVVIPPGFEGTDNPGATALLAELRDRRVPIRVVSSGTTFDPGRGLIAEALHPPEGWLPGAPDNDRSLVLDVSDGRSHLLLTGDLDGAGLAELLALPRRPIDAMLAPHHGGRSANPPWLYDWAEPGRVIASQRRPLDPAADALAPLERAGVPVLRPWREGAIRVRWGPDGLAVAPTPPDDAPMFPIAATSAWITPLAGLLAFLAGLVACLVLGVVEFGAWSLVTAGRRHDPNRPDVEPAPWEPVSAIAHDGVRLAGALRIAPRSGGRTVVLLHGFAEDRAALLGRAEAMVDRGWNAALLDSRGRGASGGDRTSFGGREADDLLAWLDALADRLGPEAVFAAWGRSMGSAIALKAAARDPAGCLRALVLEAPYPDLTPTVAAWLRRLKLPGFFAGPILRRAADLAGVPLATPRPIELAPRVTVPTLIVHGDSDPIASLSEARRLAGALGGRHEFEVVPGARHSDVFDVGGPRLADHVATFLDAAVPTRTLPASRG